MMEAKDAIWTYTGRVIRPLAPDPNEICIEDIAHALGNSCRFTGHCRKFYSVAQHSWLVADCLDEWGHPELGLQGLLHDASEAYLSDLARPVKRSPVVAEVYDEAEARLMRAVAKKFGLEYPFPEEVTWADNALLRAEGRDLMPSGFSIEMDHWGGNFYAWRHKVIPVTPDVAEQIFLETYWDIINLEVPA